MIRRNVPMPPIARTNMPTQMATITIMRAKLFSTAAHDLVPAHVEISQMGNKNASRSGRKPLPIPRAAAPQNANCFSPFQHRQHQEYNPKYCLVLTLFHGAPRLAQQTGCRTDFGVTGLLCRGRSIGIEGLHPQLFVSLITLDDSCVLEGVYPTCAERRDRPTEGPQRADCRSPQGSQARIGRNPHRHASHSSEYRCSVTLKKSVAGKNDFVGLLPRRPLNDFDEIGEIENHTLDNRSVQIGCCVGGRKLMPRSSQAGIPIRRALAMKKRDKDRDVLRGFPLQVSKE